MAEGLDLEAMLARFRDRAHAVSNRPLPPVAGEERTKFIQQAQNDYQDFAIIGDARPASRTGSSPCGSTCGRPADRPDDAGAG